ncbi:hypothetical protein GCM10028818_12920 [Spirosoma horti]
MQEKQGLTKVDISSTAIEKGLDIAKEFLQKLVQPSVEELGLLVSDQIKYWRFKNQLNTVLKAQKYIEEKKINVKQIPLKILTPLLESASLEEDEKLQDKWAALLANSASSTAVRLSNIYSFILSQITYEEATFLEHIAEFRSEDIRRARRSFYLSEAEIANIVRLGLVKYGLPQVYVVARTGYYDSQEISNLEESEELFITQLGLDFIQMCTLR